jgi:hypothetical protein
MALSRAERLIVCGWLVLITATVLSVAAAARHHRVLRMVRSDFRVIEESCVLFLRAYQRWPVPKDLLYDQRFGQPEETPASHLFNALRAIDGPGNRAHVINPERKVFLELRPAAPGRSGLRPDGDFLDPWGSPYQVILDVNGDNICEILETRFGSALSTRVAVWSYGPDRRSDTVDDRFSWK